MKNLFQRLRCWVNDHETPPDYYGDETCIKCGQWVPAGETLGLRKRWWYWWLYNRPEWLRLRYYRKCPDCGGRLGKHTPACPPF